jgi:hypothetical protein
VQCTLARIVHSVVTPDHSFEYGLTPSSVTPFFTALCMYPASDLCPPAWARPWRFSTRALRRFHSI